MALQYVEAQRQARPDLADWYAALADLYQRKLWHQLTLKLDQFLQLQAAQAGDTIIQLYNNFITDFETKINLLKLAHFVVIASRQYPDKDAAITFLEGVITKLRETRESRINEPILYVKMQIAAINLEKGNQKECKNLLEEGKTTLDSMTDVDPTVHASFYWISSQYHKTRQEFAEFYKNALLYLAYTTVESLSESFKLDLAFDLSLAALLGDNIYNFGELLAHPIVSNTFLVHDLFCSHPYSSYGIVNHLNKINLDIVFYFSLFYIYPQINSLIGTKVEWVYHMLQAFNTGNLALYQELCRVHNAALSAQPALLQNERKLLEKINILCLMEIIFSRPSEDRTIPLSVIAEQTKLSISDVECLLMKSLSVHLIEGIIDEVDSTVHVSWVQPRVLGIPQVKALRDRLDAWVGKVHTTLLSVEAETPDLVAA
ncbi:26S proteasome non-ATPase regulatory subunit 13-like protein B [Dichanthelium oligosanthes]|uniref:26S proteasome non-ATPase regulatory subunit 13-like protein B n=1 Tax=Dichanthelium oligosanthes TaxID=888268 RepID=A0A1E5UTU0_9POAL|nr:26S proteasome non-ATPase regulatory subunit 13-like protein B [Dichanthelium oligosanthes]